MSGILWRPADEAGAVATISVFLEWLRAVRHIVLPGPEAVPAWAAAEPAAFAAALADFAGLAPARGWRGNLLRHAPKADALVLGAATDEPRRWTRAALCRGKNLPPPLAAVLEGGSWSALLRLAASHLLVAETRPDDRLLWLGDPADPWPYGAWLAGARLVLPGDGDPAAIAALTGAMAVAAAPAEWPIRLPA
jgi:hypothetical protein